MALSSLNPLWRRVFMNFTPETGGDPTDEFELTFRCPVCGPPAIIAIKVGPSMDAARHVWQIVPAEPFLGWADEVTIQPSIDNTRCGHGPRRPPCAFHGSVVNGKVVFP